MNQSTVIRKLEPNEITLLKEELKKRDDMWIPHFPDLRLTQLKDGKSIHLQWCDNELNIAFSHWDKFPKTHELLNTFVSEGRLGRAYWHRLLPGEGIEPHTDASIPFVKSGRLLHRYQIYLDLESDTTIFIDNKTIDPKWAENSIIDFELRNLHYYKNTSSSTVYLLVFDVVMP